MPAPRCAFNDAAYLLALLGVTARSSVLSLPLASLSTSRRELVGKKADGSASA